MKIQGVAVEVKNEVVVIPLGGRDCVFEAKPILDYEAFYVRFPRPEPPLMKKPGGGPDKVLETDPKYVEALNEWAELKTSWMVIKSLEATEGLAWDTVDHDKSETWGNYVKDLETSGFSEYAIALIIGIVMIACGLNQSKIDEATKSFLAARDETPKP